MTYMNRPASVQVDTLEQRARAFGIAATCFHIVNLRSKITVRFYGNRSHRGGSSRPLRDHIEDNGSVHTWAKEIGLLLPDGMTPTRASVVPLFHDGLGRHSMRMPSRVAEDVRRNLKLVEGIGFLRRLM